MEADKDQYYQALRSSQQKLESLQDFSLTWAAFFLELLKTQKDELKAKIDRERNANRLPDLSLKIESLAKDYGRVTVAFLTGELKANRTLTIGATMHTIVLADRNHGLDGSLFLVQ